MIFEKINEVSKSFFFIWENRNIFDEPKLLKSINSEISSLPS